jgi:tetratricopeptide (TPR) repeat protein
LLEISPDAPPELLARRDYILTALVPFDENAPPEQAAKAIGIALAQAGQWELAVNALTQAKGGQLSNHEQAETLAFLGHALAQVNRPALALFEQAQQLDPESALPAYFRGVYLRHQAALQGAEQLFEQALQLDPDNAAIYLELALTKTEQGDLLAAEEAYNNAVSIADNDVQMQLARLRFYASRGYRVEEAGIPAAEAIIKIDADNAEAHSLLGWLYFISADFVEAETALQKALELDPSLVSARYHLARTLEANNKPEDAKAAYLQVVDEDITGEFRTRALQDLQRLRS